MQTDRMHAVRTALRLEVLHCISALQAAGCAAHGMYSTALLAPQSLLPLARMQGNSHTLPSYGSGNGMWHHPLLKKSSIQCMLSQHDLVAFLVCCCSHIDTLLPDL
jgi:hypothetical protein